jgi:hypothetical protein
LKRVLDRGQEHRESNLSAGVIIKAPRICPVRNNPERNNPTRNNTERPFSPPPAAKLDEEKKLYWHPILT